MRWTDPATGHTLFGAVDDILEFPDQTLAVLDYKSSGANEITIYPSYQLQMDVYTFLLQKMGYRTHPKAYLAFFVAVKDGGFNGHLPFRGEVREVQAQDASFRRGVRPLPLVQRGRFRFKGSR